MFTLIRPISALVMAIIGLIAAQFYTQLYAGEAAQLGRFHLWLAALAAVIGYGFLGTRVARGPGWAVYFTLQAVVLTALLAAATFALRMVFIFGQRRIYREPVDAVEGFFDHMLRFLAIGLNPGFLLFLAGASLATGIGLHLVFRLLERRRLAR